MPLPLLLSPCPVSLQARSHSQFLDPEGKTPQLEVDHPRLRAGKAASRGLASRVIDWVPPGTLRGECASCRVTEDGALMPPRALGTLKGQVRKLPEVVRAEGMTVQTRASGLF